MNKRISIRTFIVPLFAVSFFSCNGQVQKEDVDAVTFQQHLNKTNVQLLDVRTAEEYEAGHIKAALLANWMNKDEFTDRVKYLAKDKPVLVYCASGLRSGQ